MFGLVIPAPGQSVLKAELCYFQPQVLSNLLVKTYVASHLLKVGELLKSPLTASLNSGEERAQTLRSYEAAIADSDDGESIVADNARDEVPGSDNGMFEEENCEGYEGLLSDD